MIYEMTGDILLSHAVAIAHGIAPNDHFDSGLALALRDRWPAMVRDFRHWARAHHPKPGTLFVWGGTHHEGGGTEIISLLTQDGDHHNDARPGKATLTNVDRALRALATQLREAKTASLALPRLATGVGGLAWSDVEPLVREHLGALAIPIYLYTTYRAGIAAVEPRA